ncbi:hypothetical protein DNTS_021572 [Danionella cerebrum]|uniref:Uncharacterized protein n=1 Tax=Danionella cerebrum TaxID=2873325 RepID=A0A553QXI3_9TELE|nr:hypothetical protein DNTS_021572 [Danionella translucida]
MCIVLNVHTMLFLVILSSLSCSACGAALQDDMSELWNFTESCLLTLWQSRIYLYTAVAVVFGVWFTINLLFVKKWTLSPVSMKARKPVKKQEVSGDVETVIHVSCVKVFYGSQTGTGKVFTCKQI